MVGIGGAALMSISLGQRNADRARQALGNAFWLLVGIGAAVTAVLLPLHKPLLYLLGCSDALYPYAGPYFTVYILGTLASLLGVGLNQFLLAQGFARQGMIAVVLGALTNVVLDPLFLFGLRLGVAVQYALVDSLTAMGKVRYAFPLSIFRKLLYLVCLVVLPRLGPVENVFYAGSLSDLAGATFSVVVFFLFVLPRLRREMQQPAGQTKKS